MLAQNRPFNGRIWDAVRETVIITFHFQKGHWPAEKCQLAAKAPGGHALADAVNVKLTAQAKAAG